MATKCTGYCDEDLRCQPCLRRIIDAKIESRYPEIYASAERARHSGDVVAGFLGLTSSASARGDCHYCGLALSNGSCQECD